MSHAQAINVTNGLGFFIIMSKSAIEKSREAVGLSGTKTFKSVGVVDSCCRYQ